MAVFYFMIGRDLPVMVVPETRVYMDGHPILTHSYSIYKDYTTDNLDDLLSPDEQKNNPTQIILAI
ncbi:hypothetical protein HK413_09725 [Mucilaginibacter sp. S1162]|uniref:Uncharacterized protein n=1 Tax=Mucilaginibacter humi TaxID=2732510 RepID=A0ABX1W2A0_9SPHI|nr:hypothetical protein [Mucilaginibacter humi]NNU34352.1 hypothetical protein [Mucilaginibacter humi]